MFNTDHLEEDNYTLTEIGETRPISIKKRARQKVKSYSLYLLSTFPNNYPPWAIHNTPPSDDKVKTEDVGKILEMAICLVFGTPFIGNFKYDMESAKKLSNRMNTLPKYFPGEYIHTASGGSNFDFTNSQLNKHSHISAKTNKSGYKVAPYSIGQPTPETFCKRVGIPFIDIPTLKENLQNPNLLRTKLLPIFEDHTFDAPIIYYHKQNNTIKIITQVSKISWNNINFNWTKSHLDWNNSSSLQVNKKTILEVQFHTKNRKNMVNRWNIKNVLLTFPECFQIISL